MPQFAAHKAAAAIGYLVKSTGADLYSVMKMLYLADKAHLESFGRTISGDVYCAMEKGPVPDRAYNLCKFVRGDRAHFDALPEARKLFRLHGNDFELLAEPDMNELSRSDVDALDEVSKRYQAGGWRAVYAASHDDAWKDAWAVAEARGKGSVSMDFDAIAATLPSGNDLIEYLADRQPGEAPGVAPDC